MGSIPDNAILVTADVTALYPSIPHDVGLKALREVLDKREQKKIPTEELVQMAEFVLKNNFFEFNGHIKQQISGTAIGAKCAPTNACIYMDKMEGEFLEKQEHKPFTWLRYIDYMFFISTHGEDKLKTFLGNLNQFHPNINFSHESSTESIPFLDLCVKLSQGKLETDLHKTYRQAPVSPLFFLLSGTYQAINSLQPNFKSC